MPVLAAAFVGVLVLVLVLNFAKSPSYFVTVSFIGLTNGSLVRISAPILLVLPSARSALIHVKARDRIWRNH